MDVRTENTRAAQSKKADVACGSPVTDWGAKSGPKDGPRAAALYFRNHAKLAASSDLRFAMRLCSSATCH